MQKKLCFVLSLTVLCNWGEPSPINSGTLEFDNLDSELGDLKYEVEEEDLDDYSKLLDDAEDARNDDKSTDKEIKTFGYKKKDAKNKGVKSRHNLQDLKKIFKLEGVKDKDYYDDDDVHAAVGGLAAEAVRVKGKEERKYRKGTKTKGFHRVHHKDEYEKNKEFYDEDRTNGVIRKVGGKTLGYKINGGARYNKGHSNHDRRKGVYGKKGYSDKGYLNNQYSDFSDAQGFDESFDSY